MPAVLQPNAAIVANLRRKTVGDEDIAAAKGHAAGTLFVAQDGSVLLLHRSPNEKNFAGHWSLPGGGVEDGETPEAGAEREAIEEMGPDVPRGRRKLIDQKVTPTGMVFHTFAQPVDEKFVPQLNGEHTGFTWSPMNALPGPMHPAVQDTLTNRVGVAADMSPEDWEGMVGGLLKFLAEEAQEPEHAGDSEWEEGKHPRNDKGEFSGTFHHGSNAEFESFDPSKHGSTTDPGFYGVGLSLTPSQVRAKGYADFAVSEKGGEGRVHTFDVHFKKPLHTEQGAFAFSDAVEKATGNGTGDPKEKTDRLKNAGYDGVVVHRKDGSVFELTAFDPNSLKKKSTTKTSGGAEDTAFALDRESVRTKDVDGRLHVADVPLCRESVDPYKGSEIPGCKRLGLDPEKIYHLWRPAEELEKAVPTIRGIPVLRKHVATSAADHKSSDVIGAIGTNARWEAPFIIGELVIWPAKDIAGIETKEKYNLSPGYRYEPIMEVGNFNGTAYDGKMTKIVFNHEAVVEHGRQAEVAIDSVEELRWAKIERALLSI